MPRTRTFGSANSKRTAAASAARWKDKTTGQTDDESKRARCEGGGIVRARAKSPEIPRREHPDTHIESPRRAQGRGEPSPFPSRAARPAPPRLAHSHLSHVALLLCAGPLQLQTTPPC